MAQQVLIAGALFNDVPSISVPDSNNVYHPFVDTSDANASAGDIASGKTAYVNGTKITGTGSGGGGGGLKYETGTWTPTSDIARGNIGFAESHTEAPVIIVLADATGTAHSETNSNYAFVFFDYYKLWGTGIPYTADGFRYASAYYSYRAGSTSTVTVNGITITNNSDDQSDSSTVYPRYWATETAFYPYTNSSSRYWRRGRTYKWIAIWK